MNDDRTTPEADDLRSRLQRGELRRERLTLARALGHEASGLALGRTRPTDDEALDPEATLEFWGRRLGRWGPTVMLRAAAFVARDLGAQSQLPPETAAAFADGLAVVERFLARSDGAHDAGEVPLNQACERSSQDVARQAVSHPADSPAQRACLTLLPLLRAVGDLVNPGSPGREALRAHYLRVLEQAQAASVDHERVREALRAGLLDWALA